MSSPFSVFSSDVVFKLEAEPEAPPVPACVEKAKLPKTRSVVRQAEVVCEAMEKPGGTVLT